jgi:hypothetical protein
MDLAMMRKGALAGLGVLFLLLLGDRFTAGSAPFGYRTLVIGFVASGLLLVGGLGMALTSYQLARRGRAKGLRMRLLQFGLFCGTAGFLLSLGVFGAWIALGRPSA